MMPFMKNHPGFTACYVAFFSAVAVLRETPFYCNMAAEYDETVRMDTIMRRQGRVYEQPRAVKFITGCKKILISSVTRAPNFLSATAVSFVWFGTINYFSKREGG